VPIGCVVQFGRRMDDELLFTGGRLGCARHSVGVKIRKGCWNFHLEHAVKDILPLILGFNGAIDPVRCARRAAGDPKAPSRAMVMR